MPPSESRTLSRHPLPRPSGVPPDGFRVQRRNIDTNPKRKRGSESRRQFFLGCASGWCAGVHRFPEKHGPSATSKLARRVSVGELLQRATSGGGREQVAESRDPQEDDEDEDEGNQATESHGKTSQALRRRKSPLSANLGRSRAKSSRTERPMRELPDGGRFGASADEDCGRGAEDDTPSQRDPVHFSHVRPRRSGQRPGS